MFQRELNLAKEQKKTKGENKLLAKAQKQMKRDNESLIQRELTLIKAQKQTKIDNELLLKAQRQMKSDNKLLFQREIKLWQDQRNLCKERKTFDTAMDVERREIRKGKEDGLTVRGSQQEENGYSRIGSSSSTASSSA